MIKSIVARARLAWHIYTTFAVVVFRIRVRRIPLPRAVALVEDAPPLRLPRGTPLKLGRAIHRSLSVGRAQPRCLTLALTHFTLLARVGLIPDLVIGLPRSDTSDAHAWVEIGGRDVGPPPGRDGSVELARFGLG
jgi:hypothetical protein